MITYEARKRHLNFRLVSRQEPIGKDFLLIPNDYETEVWSLQIDRFGVTGGHVNAFLVSFNEDDSESEPALRDHTMIDVRARLLDAMRKRWPHFYITVNL